MSSFFAELSIVMFLAFIISYIANKIKQPLLIGYIITGILAGPIFLNILSDSQGYETFAHIGVALLLFIVGLHLNLKLIKEVGLISLVTGLGQVLFTSFFGFLFGIVLGFNIVSSIIIAIAITFSSTIIIVKLLTDKNDLDKLYGKISMGFLIVQDFVAVLILMIISSLIGVNSEKAVYVAMFETIVVGFIAIVITYILSHFILPKFLDKIARSSELLFMFIIAWAIGISSIFLKFGFSIEIGALLAGIALASSPYQSEISSRIRPLRDFFVVMFFILLGSQMIPTPIGSEQFIFSDRMDYILVTLSSLFWPVVIYSLFILIGNPLIVLVLMSLLGYSSRIGFLAGLTVAQISEFSLILAMISQKAGLLTVNEVSIITFVGIVTITISTYMIMHGEKLYKIFSKFLVKFDNNKKFDSEKKEINKYEVLIFGYDRIGYSVLKTIEKLHKKYLVVDYDPEIIRKLENARINCVFGDAGDVNFISDFDMNSVKILVSTIPDFEISSILFKEFKKGGHQGAIILTSHDIGDALELYKLGADYVISPNYLGGHYVSNLIETHQDNFQDFLTEKVKHINELKERHEFSNHEGKIIK